jgi:hypothetical protein
MLSDAQKATLLEQHGALLHQIEKWRDLQAMYMPRVSDTGISEPGRGKAESIKLWLPSHLDVTKRDSLCLVAITTIKRELGFGQLDDALNELQRVRQI